MQITDKRGVVKIVLSQEEGRRFRDVAYLGRRAAANLGAEGADLAERLIVGAAAFLEFADKCTPERSQKKLDRQDAFTEEIRDAFADIEKK